MTQRAIVTGVSRGIGRAVAEMLLGSGWTVCGLSRTPPDIRHPRFSWWQRDIAAPDFLLPRPFASLDALIHCAGIRGPYGPLAENDPDAWVQTIQANLLGTFRVVRAALPLLQRSEDARILLFSGGGAFGPEPCYSAYAASKGATISLMETLAIELIDTTVTVNAVAPGFVATTIHQGTPHEAHPETEDALPNVVACVKHLLSPHARGLTGRTVSAQWDDWEQIAPWTIPYMGDQGTRTRHKIEDLQHTMIRHKRAI